MCLQEKTPPKAEQRLINQVYLLTPNIFSKGPSLFWKKKTEKQLEEASFDLPKALAERCGIEAEGLGPGMLLPTVFEMSGDSI